MAGFPQQVSRPMSIKEIVEIADDFDFNPEIPLKNYLRTADNVLKEGRIYDQEHSDQQAYLLYMRYATLVTSNLVTHPGVRDPENQRGLKTAIKAANEVVERLAILKPRINARYEAYQRALERRREASSGLHGNGTQSKTYFELAASDPAIAGKVTTLNAEENSDLAVKLAHKEIRRRDAAKRSPQKPGVSDPKDHEARIAGLWDDWEAGLSKNGRSREEISREDEEMRRNMEASRQRLDGSQDNRSDSRKRITKTAPRPTRPIQERNGGSEYRYPSIQKSQPPQLEDSRSLIIHSQPPKPPKELLEKFDEPPKYTLPPLLPPSLPGKFDQTTTYTQTPSVPEKTLVNTREEHDTEIAPPNTFTFRPSAYLENGKPLRTVFLPPTLHNEFLSYAAPNTRKNLETCGVLCGTLISNALFISRVVIPEQISTSDTCETTNEVALFDYCSSEDLMVLGWIHTHPTQTCFMSSRDLHTHYGYQTMIAESIAIVCAPTKTPSWGIFRLTDPPGMKCVKHCDNTGIFHPHSEKNMYTDALRPGHVVEAIGLEYKVVDLRP